MHPIYRENIPSHHIIGPAIFLVVSSVASYIFRLAPLLSITWVSIGAASGWLAKKTTHQYTDLKHITRNLLQVENTAYLQRPVVVATIAISSLLFPHISAVFAFSYGFFVGFVL